MKEPDRECNYIASFSPLRRGGLAFLYLLIGGCMVPVLCKLFFPENIYLEILLMIISGENGIIELAVLVLLLFTLPAFIMLLYNSLSLFFICLSIEREKCFIKSEGPSIRYSSPDISRGWSAEYNGGYADLTPGNVKSISMAEKWSRFHLIPVREIYVEYADGRSLVIDSVFFKEPLSDIKERLEFMAFPHTAPEPQKKLAYREGESILDEDGNFIPPG